MKIGLTILALTAGLFGFSIFSFLLVVSLNFWCLVPLLISAHIIMETTDSYE